MTGVEETLRIKIGEIEVFFTHSTKGLLGFNSIHSFIQGVGQVCLSKGHYKAIYSRLELANKGGP
jgi:hypothetical protein